MKTEVEVGVLYTIWQSDNGQFFCSPEDASLVERGMKLWADSRRDTLLSLTGPTGQEFAVLASSITTTTRSTPECRAAAALLDKAIDDERKANRAAAGFLESE